MRPGSAGGCLPPSARTCGSGREVSAGAPRAASGVRRVGPPASPRARGTASRRDSPVPEAPVPCDSHPSLPPSLRACSRNTGPPCPRYEETASPQRTGRPCPWRTGTRYGETASPRCTGHSYSRARRPGTAERSPTRAQDTHISGAREPGTVCRPVCLPSPAPSAHLPAGAARAVSAAVERREVEAPRAAAGPFYRPPPLPGGEGRSGPGNCPDNADWPPPRRPGRPLAAQGGRGPAPARASREAKFQETWLRARSPAGAGRECRGAGAGARRSRGRRDRGCREQEVTGIWGS